MYLYDTASATITDIRSKAMRLKAQYDIQVLFIDNLQSIEATTLQNRAQAIAYVCSRLKAIARELQIAVVVSSQLSRAVETRGGSMRPMLSDLRESGAIEQDADLVMFLYRGEYYGITEDEDGNEYMPGQTELIIAKNRNGHLEEVPLKFIPQSQKFESLEYSSVFTFSDPIKFDNITKEEDKDTPF